jgi:tetratricopeptide (TPR) repeat protein
MTADTESRSGNSRIAVGILVDEDTLPLLHKTIVSARTLSDHIFVLTVGKNCDVTETGITVEHGGGLHDEAACRNMLIGFVENANVADWLVWLNPGEEFEAKTLDEFHYFLDHDSHRNTLYMMVLHRYFREDRVRHDFDEETIDARLMPLRKGIRFQGRVRATLIPRSVSLMTEISAAPGRFLLPPKKLDPTKTAKRAKQLLEILENIEKEGEVIQDDLLAARAEALFILGDYIDSRKLLLQLIKGTTRSDLRLSAYFSLCETFTVAPIPEAEVTKLMVEALDHFPVEMQLLTSLGGHLQRSGKLDLAVRTYETAIQHGRVSLDVWHRLRIREITITSLALCHRLQNRNDDAIRVLETNTELVEDRSEYNRHLLDLYIAENREEDASALAAEIWGDVDLDLIRLVLKGACIAKTGHWDNALAPLAEAHRQGCRDILCLRWYALALLALQQFRLATDILAQWLAVQPDNSEAKSYLAAAQQPDQFGETLKRIRDTHLRSLGMMGKKMAPRSPNIRVEEAVREMIQASGARGPGSCGCKKSISGFKPKVKERG